jgi:pRiA4b ORF-3-like protein
MVTDSEHSVYQIKVTLDGIQPPIWRRLVVPASTTLKDLHDVLQVALGWTDSHPHEFEARGVRYGQADPEFGMERLDEKRIPLDQVLRK